MGLILFIVVATVMATIAIRKGFNPFLWILAGGIPGFLILLSLPTGNVEDIPEATRKARIKRGNIVGGVISAIAIVGLIALGAVISNLQ